MSAAVTAAVFAVGLVGFACAIYLAVLSFAQLAEDFKKERPHR